MNVTVSVEQALEILAKAVEAECKKTILDRVTGHLSTNGDARPAVRIRVRRVKRVVAKAAPAPARKRRVMSPETRAKMAASAKKRWAAAKREPRAKADA